MITVTVKYGIGNEVIKEYEDGITIQDVLGDTDVRAQLGFGTNVNTLVNDEYADPSYELEDGDVLIIEQRASQKA